MLVYLELEAPVTFIQMKVSLWGWVCWNRCSGHTNNIIFRCLPHPGGWHSRDSSGSGCMWFLHISHLNMPVSLFHQFKLQTPKKGDKCDWPKWINFTLCAVAWICSRFIPPLLKGITPFLFHTRPHISIKTIWMEISHCFVQYERI